MMKSICTGKCAGSGVCPISRCISNDMHDMAPLWVRRRKVRAGRKATHEFVPVEGLCIVISGALKVVSVGIDGNQFVDRFVFPGEFLELRPWPANPIGNAVALTDVGICEVDYRWSKRLELTRLEIDRVLFAAAIKQAHHMSTWQRVLVIKRPVQRLIRFLIDIADRTSKVEHGYCLLDLPMSRVDIAAYLGLQRETVSRSFTILRNLGLISMPSRHSCVILDLVKFRAQIYGEEFMPTLPSFEAEFNG